MLSQFAKAKGRFKTLPKRRSYILPTRQGPSQHGLAWQQHLQGEAAKTLCVAIWVCLKTGTHKMGSFFVAFLQNTPQKSTQKKHSHITAGAFPALGGVSGVFSKEPEATSRLMCLVP